MTKVKETREQRISRRAGKRAAKNRVLASQFFGNEPMWDPELDAEEDHQIGRLLNWYNYKKDHKASKKYLLEYMKEENYTDCSIEKVRKAGQYAIPQNTGFVARIILNGAPLSDKYITLLEDRIETAAQDGEKQIEAEKEEAARKANTKSIQERVQDRIMLYCGHIDGEIDNFIENKFKSDFEPKDFFSQKSVKSAQASKIAEKFVPVLEEWKEARKGKDPDLKEGYSCFKKAQLKKMIGFLENIIDEANAWAEVAKTIRKKSRKSRAKKVKPAAKLVEKMKYEETNSDHGIDLTSIDPKKIIGAQQLWIFNTKYRRLGVYNATDGGFTVKGTTVKNIDPATSVAKKLRKPEVILSTVQTAGKVSLRKIFKDIRCKERALNGRINGDTILLRVF